MEYIITTNCAKSADIVYDTLVNPNSGVGVLAGHKVCIDETSVPDVMVFDLTHQEAAKLRESPLVKRVTLSIGEPQKFPFNKVSQKSYPKLASFAQTFNGNSVLSACPHSLYYCQSYDLNFIQNDVTNGSSLITLSSIDCSNVDILIMDSGVDATHRDFFDSGGNSRVVNFNWTQLKTGIGGDMSQGSAIVATQDGSYYTDTDGHGTCCASLVAGNRCGYAKNAKIYSLKCSSLGGTNGYGVNTCLDLALSFHKSKKQNLYGLDANRPTVFTNSWGYSGIVFFDNNENNTAILNNTLGYGKGLYNGLVAENATTDGYIRQLLNEGVHVLVAAGNNNQLLDNNGKAIYVWQFTNAITPKYLVYNSTNQSSYIAGAFYSGLGTCNGYFAFPYSYGSPNIGVGESPTTYPLIKVGCIIPVGANDTIDNLCWTAGNGYAAYVGLTGLTTNYRDLSSFIKEDSATRYTSLSGPFFVKSQYSNFGPDVDIYTPGNGAWAAFSNQSSDASSAQFTVSLNNNYKFFNGTSSACPIAAGILATYVASFTGATPSQAKNWLLNNSVSGNIVQTLSSSLVVNCFLQGTGLTTINWPTGYDLNQVQIASGLRVGRYIYNPSYLPYFNTGNIYDLLHQFRFFNSNNRIAQAYPLRGAVLQTNQSSVTINGATLTLSGSPTQEKITHTI